MINLDDDSDVLSFDDLPVEITITSEGEVSIISAEDSAAEGSIDIPVGCTSDIADNNEWTTGPVVSENGVIYEVSTDWQTTDGVDGETHYQFSLLLDFDTANTGAAIETGLEIAMSWGSNDNTE